MKKILFELNEVINQKRINFRKDEQSLSSFEELVKISILLDLLEKRFEERTPIIDLTNTSMNKMEQFFIYSENREDIEETDFDCLKDFIDIDSIRQFHLTHNYLKLMPAKIFANFKYITDLDLNCQLIECVVENNFFLLHNLTSLAIINCSVFNIEENAFSGLKNLKSLVLTMNYIQDIDSKMFTDLENLEHLNISQNVIDEIRENTFICLKSLNCLMLTDNKIEKLHKNAFNGLNSLKTLDLNFNKKDLKIDQSALESVTGLEILDIGNNDISNIDKDVFKKIR